jgi:hypothetical protein
VLLKIEVDEDGYQLLVDDQESGVADYGEQAEVEVEGVLYFVTVIDEDAAEEAVIYRMVDGRPGPVAETHEVEDVEFEVEEEDEDEDEADEETKDAVA